MHINILLSLPKTWFMVVLLVLPLLLKAQHPDFTSTISVISSTYSDVQHICSDATGATYATGIFNDTLTIGNETRVASGPVGSSQHVFVAKYTQQGAPTWVRHIKLSTGSITTGLLTVQNITADSTGNLWVLGLYSTRPLEIEGSSTTYLPAQSGNVDTYLAKYNTQGVLQWVKTFATAADDWGNGLAADKQGHVFIGVSPRRAYNGYDSTMTHLYKLDAAGVVVSFRRDTGARIPYTMPDSKPNGITSLVYDTKNDVLYAAGIIGVAQQVAGAALSAPNGQDMFVASYTGNLTPLQAQLIPSVPPVPNPGRRLTASINQMVVSKQSGVIAAISFYGNIVLGNATYAAACPATNAGVCYDGLVVNFSPTGTPKWIRRVGMKGIVSGLSALPTGDIILCGNSSNDFLFGNYQFIANANSSPNSNHSNGFVATIDTSGAPVWLRQSWGGGFMSVTNDGTGNIWAAGFVAGSASFNGIVVNHVKPNGLIARLGGIATRLGFIPTAGSAGTTVVINGQNFQNTTSVRFNNTPATTFRVNGVGDQIVATVPVGATTGTIAIVSPQGITITTTAFQINGPLSTETGSTTWLNIYPNPAQQRVWVNIPANQGPVQLTLLDGLGRTIRTKNSQQGGELNVIGLVPGLYLLRATTPTGTVTRRLSIE